MNVLMENVLSTINLLKQPLSLMEFRFESVDENVKSHPKQLWKYVSKFRKEVPNLIQLDIDGILFTKPCDIADAFAKYFQPVHSNFSSGTFCSLNQCMEVFSSHL
jgi:hypothetical protein